MLKLRKLLSHKSGDRLDFKFSDFKALQVPIGFEKLYVLIVLVERDKTLYKTKRTWVRDGFCQWTDAFSKYIRISNGDAYIKLILVDSSRSTILGDAHVNLAICMSSKRPVSISLPLENCNYGTTLQLKIHCLTPIENGRDRQWNDTNLETGDMIVESSRHSHADGVSLDHIVVSYSTEREITPNPRVREEINNPRGSSKFHKILEFFKNLFLMNICQLFKHRVSLLSSAAREAQSGADEISCEGSSSASTEMAQMNKAVIIVEIYFEPAMKEVFSIASNFPGIKSIHMEIKDEKLVLTVIGDFDMLSLGTELSMLWVIELVSFGPA